MLDRAENIEGLRDYLGTFADSSEESANAIAGLAGFSDTKLKEIVAGWQKLQDKYSEISEGLAELQTDFSTSMDEIQTGLEEDIRDMNLSEEAAESARKTLEGYFNGMNQKLPTIQRTLADIRRSTTAALMGSVPKISVSGTTDTSDTSRHPGRSGGYASGTQNAAPGLTLVGEEGPELVYFHGGEKVLTATQTAALRDSVDIQNRASEISDLLQIQEIYSRMERAAAAFPAVQTVSENSVLPSVQDAAPTPAILPDTAGNNTLPPIQINIQVSSNATPETVTALRDTSADIADVVASRVMDMLENQQTDRTRLVYR